MFKTRISGIAVAVSLLMLPTAPSLVSAADEIEECACMSYRWAIAWLYYNNLMIEMKLLMLQAVTELQPHDGSYLIYQSWFCQVLTSSHT